MKVVLFCGGLGMRLRENSEHVPKPMVTIGYRPIMWHLMKYYASFGHKDFILCLGYRGDVVKKYFLEYDECLSNNFTLSEGGRKVKLLNSDIQDWTITFVDTGAHANIGQRLQAVKGYLQDEEMFLANYSDGLTDAKLSDHIAHFHTHNKVASFLCVKPNLTYHFVLMHDNHLVHTMQDITHTNIRINGGYFIFKKEIFNYIREEEELVAEPFQRLIQEDQLLAYKYDGFWAGMDTFKDKQMLEKMYESGPAPWEVWKNTALG